MQSGTTITLQKNQDRLGGSVSSWSVILNGLEIGRVEKITSTYWRYRLQSTGRVLSRIPSRTIAIEELILAHSSSEIP